MHVKKGDTVRILNGDDKGKTGKIVLSLPSKNKVLVEGVNVIKKHQKPRQQGQQGQIVERAMPIDVSNVVLADAPVKKIAKPAAKVAAKKAAK